MALTTLVAVSSVAASVSSSNMATTKYLEDVVFPGEPKFSSTPCVTPTPCEEATASSATAFDQEVTVIYNKFVDNLSDFSKDRTKRLMPALRQARITASEALEKVGKLATTVHDILDQTRIDPLCVHFVEIRRKFQHLKRVIRAFAEKLYRVVFGYYGRDLASNDSEIWFLPDEIDTRLRDLNKQIAVVCESISCQRLYSVISRFRDENYDLGDFTIDLTAPRNLCLGPQ